MDIDFKSLTFEELNFLARGAEEERKRREVMEMAEAKVREIQRTFLETRDRDTPAGEASSWTQPTGAHDCYPKDFVVRHNNKIWVNSHPFNSWEPGTTNSQWVEAEEDTDSETGLIKWGVGQEIKTGDIRLHDGARWSALIDHVTHEGWAPSQYAHAVWSLICPEESSSEQPPPAEDESDTPDGYVGTWSKSASYKINDIVDKDGKYWKCLVAHGAEYQGTWAPGLAHTVWQEVGTV